MGMGFQFEQHRLGLWDLSWDLKKKNNFLGNGIRTPPSRPSLSNEPLVNQLDSFTILAIDANFKDHQRS